MMFSKLLTNSVGSTDSAMQKRKN